MRITKRLIFLFLIYGGLLAFLMATNPNKLSITWLLVPFIWLFFAVFYSLLTVFQVIDRMTTRLQSRQKQYSIAAVAATLPSLLLLLDSVHQLTLKDGFLLTAFTIGIVFYVAKVSFKTTPF